MDDFPEFIQIMSDAGVAIAHKIENFLKN